MAYQALYRVWRSQRFDDIVGQKAVTQTLKNAIVSHKTSHACLLYTSPSPRDGLLSRMPSSA